MQQRQERPPSIEQVLHALGGELSDPEPVDPEETFHVYVEADRITLVREPPDIVESTPPSPSSVREVPSLLVGSLLLLCLLVGAVVVVFSPQPGTEHAFAVTVPGFGLTPVHQSVTVAAKATGKGFIAATTATGVITFYNGQPYTQLIPVGTILTGRDGVQIITDEQASIPPAAQTLPPTYGQVQIAAHALAAGAGGNIGAGDINQPCCVTSVIVQNPYPFIDGRDAQHFSYITKQDVLEAMTPLVTKLQAQTPQLFASSLVLSPRCTPTITATPAIGQKASTVKVAVTVSCTALSYHPQDLQQAVHRQVPRLGPGTLTEVSAQVIAIDTQEHITLYVIATWKPTAVPAPWFRR